MCETTAKTTLRIFSDNIAVLAIAGIHMHSGRSRSSFHLVRHLARLLLPLLLLLLGT